MTLTPGSRLGPYEIIAPLGAGGMGAVYRARDPRVGREVAIKVAAEQFTERFHREAAAVAALNHTNVCHLYDVGPNYLVLELVDGETLAGPVPFDDALPIIRQLIDGIEAAHEKGIIHRDLKPANIKVTPDGVVKILDFGLARALTPDEASAAADAADSPTMTIGGTRVGTILGTAAYMAPEQARGKMADRRADVWGFGAVVYELLAGAPPFSGESVADILGGVLQKEPEWSRVPAAARPLLQWCLRKDRKDRLQAIGDARILLDAAPSTAVVTASPPSRLAWGVAAASLLTAAVLAVPAVSSWRATAPVVEEIRTDVLTPAAVDPDSFALAPDGRSIVFTASGDGRPRLWLRHLASASAEPLQGTEGARFPFWSPDSRSIGFFASGKLKRLDLGGGNPQSLADATFGFGGSWHADGVILFSPTTSGPLFTVPAAGGAASVATVLPEGAESHRFPVFLPGGDQFVFFSQGASPDTTGLFRGSLASTGVHRLASADSRALFVAPDLLLFVRQGNLSAQHFDPISVTLSGEPTTVASLATIGPGRAGFSVSTTGLIAFRDPNASRRQLTWFDRSGRVLDTLGASSLVQSGAGGGRVSRAGRQTVVARRTANDTDLWVLDGLREIRLTFDPADDDNGVWSPDGRRIAFQSRRSGVQDLYWKLSNGTGGDSPLVTSPDSEVVNDWSRDGKFILFHRLDPKSGRDLWVLPMDNERPGTPRLVLQTDANERMGAFSPDGRWMAYEADPAGVFNIYVRPFPVANEGQWQVSVDGGMQARWSPDGKEIYYISADDKLMAVPVTTDGMTLSPGRPTALFDARLGLRPETGGGTGYDVAPDGRFLIDVLVDDGTASSITLVQNWRPATK